MNFTNNSQLNDSNGAVLNYTKLPFPGNMPRGPLTPPVYDLATRIGMYWGNALGSSLAILVSCFVIVVSIYHKRINGGFKWYLVNQMIGYLSQAIADFLLYTVQAIILGYPPMSQPQFFTGKSIWLAMFGHISVTFALFGQYLPMIGLLTVMINRLFSLVPSLHHYSQVYMTTRRNIIYCCICDILILMIDPRILELIGVNTRVVSPHINFFLRVVPLILSMCLCAAVFMSLRRQMKSVSNVANKTRLRENRSVLLGVFCEILFPLFTAAPMYVMIFFMLYAPQSQLGMAYMNSDIFMFWAMNLSTTNNVSKVSSLYGGLIILIVMKPYHNIWLTEVKKKMQRLQKILPFVSSDSQRSVVMGNSYAWNRMFSVFYRKISLTRKGTIS